MDRMKRARKEQNKTENIKTQVKIPKKGERTSSFFDVEGMLVISI